jgi:hypothetical protein
MKHLKDWIKDVWLRHNLPDNPCNHHGCKDEAEEGGEYCEEHYAHYYCECGNSLGEYAGEGFCPRCR